MAAKPRRSSVLHVSPAGTAVLSDARHQRRKSEMFCFNVGIKSLRGCSSDRGTKRRARHLEEARSINRFIEYLEITWRIYDRRIARN